MTTLLIAVLAAFGFVAAYHTYGRWLGGRIFRLSAETVCPSYRLEDGTDYVPTKKAIVFGHHFTSIAGTGPIVGPAIAVMWGWLPALLWVVLGSIFIGAVHDFGALVVSLRNNGQTIGDVAGRVMNHRVRLLFLWILFMALTIVLAIFGLVIAAVFRQFPASIFPCLIQIPIAVAIGLWLHRRGVGLLLPSLLALSLMYLTVVFGDRNFVTDIAWLQRMTDALSDLNFMMAQWPIWIWVVLLLGYSYIASVLPVWTLLQPRDYINSLQLITALGLVFIGLIVAGFAGGAPVDAGDARPPLEIVAPLFRWEPAGAPVIFPFLFITIACGAISGFHCLVSSGTTSKQIQCEPDARFVGYGGMLTEGFLATIVILACTAGLGLGVASDTGLLTGVDAWNARYSSWAAAGALSAMVGAFVDGAANFLSAMTIPRGVAIALMGVFVASFAGTTLDTACRLQRYVVQELASTFAPRVSSTALPADGYDLEFNVTREHPETASANAVEAAGHALRHSAQRFQWSANPLVWLTNKHGATLFAVAVAAIIAAIPPVAADLTLAEATSEHGVARGLRVWLDTNAGRGGTILWPLFGATNQLLAGLSFMVIAFYLWRRRKPLWFLILPMMFMLAMPMLAMIWQVFIGNDANPSWIATERWTLMVVGIATLVLEIWMIVEGALMFPRVRGVLEEHALDERIERGVTAG
ncbi:MAG: carbon starvation protein A [Phycisphaerales bacterium]